MKISPYSQSHGPTAAVAVGPAIRLFSFAFSLPAGETSSTHANGRQKGPTMSVGAGPRGCVLRLSCSAVQRRLRWAPRRRDPLRLEGTDHFVAQVHACSSTPPEEGTTPSVQKKPIYIQIQTQNWIILDGGSTMLIFFPSFPNSPSFFGAHVFQIIK